MSYRINRTDGELLVDLTDGNIDTTSTNLTLIGKNYQGFGELVNENFVKLLENFASTAQPSNPVTGQVWYDKQDQRLKVFNGTIFKSASVGSKRLALSMRSVPTLTCPAIMSAFA